MRSTWFSVSRSVFVEEALKKVHVYTEATGSRTCDDMKSFNKLTINEMFLFATLDTRSGEIKQVSSGQPCSYLKKLSAAIWRSSCVSDAFMLVSERDSNTRSSILAKYICRETCFYVAWLSHMLSLDSRVCLAVLKPGDTSVSLWLSEEDHSFSHGNTGCFLRSSFMF